MTQVLDDDLDNDILVRFLALGMLLLRTSTSSSSLDRLAFSRAQFNHSCFLSVRR
jgi:hypothetical protein